VPRLLRVPRERSRPHGAVRLLRAVRRACRRDRDGTGRGPRRLGRRPPRAGVHHAGRRVRPADAGVRGVRGGEVPVGRLGAPDREGLERARRRRAARRGAARLLAARRRVPPHQRVAGGRRDRERPAAPRDRAPGRNAGRAVRAGERHLRGGDARGVAAGGDRARRAAARRHRLRDLPARGGRRAPAAARRVAGLDGAARDRPARRRHRARGLPHHGARRARRVAVRHRRLRRRLGSAGAARAAGRLRRAARADDRARPRGAPVPHGAPRSGDDRRLADRGRREEDPAARAAVRAQPDEGFLRRPRGRRGAGGGRGAGSAAALRPRPAARGAVGRRAGRCCRPAPAATCPSACGRCSARRRRAR